MKKILFFIFTCAFSIVVLIFAGYYFFPQIIPITIYQMSKDKLLSADIKPSKAEFASLQINSQYKKTYTYNGISFSTNWNENEVFSTDYSMTIAFTNGRSVVMGGRQDKLDFYGDLIKTADKEGGYKKQYILDSLNMLNLKSNKDIYEYMMNVTGSDINFKKSPQVAYLNYILLILKRAYLLEADHILTFNYNGYAFYEYNPTVKTTVLDIFDEKGQHYKLNVVGTNLSQSDVNDVIGTIKIVN